jgi:flagellar motor component MotA
MKNKIIGLVIVIVTLAIVLIVVASDSGLNMGMFISPISFILVIGIASGLTLMKKDTQDEGLFPVFKHNLIFSGYIGTLIGLILVFNGHQESIGIEIMLRGISASLITLLYGYFLAYILEPFF